MLLVGDLARRARTAPWEAIELRPLTPGRLPRADRRPRRRPDRAGPPRAGRAQRRHPAVPRGARAGARARLPPRERPCRSRARSRRRSTSRSWRGCTRRPRRCRSPPRPRPPAGRSTARCSRRRSTLPAEELDSTLDSAASTRAILVPVGRQRRYHFRHELLREVAYELQPPSWRRKVHSRLSDLLAARASPSTGSWSRRTSSAPSATRRRPTRTGRPPKGLGGAARSTRPARTWRAPSSSSAAPRTTPRAITARSNCGCGADSSRCRSRAPGAATHPPTTTAASSSPPPTRSGDDDVQHAHLALGLPPLARRARPRSRGLDDAAQRARRAARRLPATNRAGFGMLEWFDGDFAGAVDDARPASARDGLSAVRRRSPRSGSCPTTPRRRCTCISPSRGSWPRTLAGADASLARAARVADPLDFPQGPWSADYAALARLVDRGSSRAGSITPGRQSPRLRRVERPARLRRLAADRRDTRPAALEASSRCARATAEPADLAGAGGRAGRVHRALEDARAADLPALLPHHGAARCWPPPGDSDGARSRYEESLAARRPRRACASTTPRRAPRRPPCARDPTRSSPRCGTRSELARSQGARPFELRIALDLHELRAIEAATRCSSARSAAFPRTRRYVDLERGAGAHVHAAVSARAGRASRSSAAAWPAMAAAWRLSEPGWRDELESITVYQRGWRLGGKGASSRGPNGRIEEHGLHLWLGYYENAFRLLRECYAELDRPRTDPTAPIQTWRDAMLPTRRRSGSRTVDDDGLAPLARHGSRRTTSCPASPTPTAAELTAVDFAAPRAAADRRLPRVAARPRPAADARVARAVASETPPVAVASRGAAVAVLGRDPRGVGAAEAHRPLRRSTTSVAALDRALAGDARGAARPGSTTTPTCGAPGTSSRS